MRALFVCAREHMAFLSWVVYCKQEGDYSSKEPLVSHVIRCSRTRNMA